ncbi:MAG: regulatory iron-sulfur-containing complex subunit RicT [Brevinema sp.]
MLHIVKVKTLFDHSLKYYRINTDVLLKQGMLFIGATKFGNDIVEIQCPKRIEMTEEKWELTLKKMGITTDQSSQRFSFEPLLDRIAKESELKKYNQNVQKAMELLSLFKDKIKEYQLEMKIIGLHFTLDKERLVCTYTAENRIDFRELVKELGATLKQRIEMFQISIVESMKFINTCGSCGRQLCCTIGCTAFIGDRKTSSKTSKFLGVCGKARCCSFFDQES